MTNYDHTKIEAKWQKFWEDNQLGKAQDPKGQSKKYILDMFPYPSGASMHVGHLEGYVGTDIIARFERMQGNAILHPMGWDAFGLPAENYAIKTGIHPNKSTPQNIQTFKRQLAMSGLSYDWDREIDTSSPEFYKWTQWLFLLMYQRGLAYKKKAPANWCPSCETVLANEQVVDGKCERCGTKVTKKELDQWFFKITEYADRLISGLSDIDWLEEVKVQQKNWIGRKEGINIIYKIENSSDTVTVFTTRPDTNFGATFVVLAPEHPLVGKLDSAEVKKYITRAATKSEVERAAEGKKKTGVFTGLFAINQLTNARMPIWVSDFVLGDVGTGALVGVPGHDKRDFEFAKEFGLEIKRVVVGQDGDSGPITSLKQVQEQEGKLINSGFLDGVEIHEAISKMMDHIEAQGWGKRVVTYHLRDWLISRQRYWGAPIPMTYCEKCSWQPVPEDQLPVLLPEDVDFKPTGESPIAGSATFQKDVVCSKCGGPARREVDTMDTYVDSSWYFIRFVDPKNPKAFASAENIKSWLPVDTYVGGGHVVQHLLFARFFWKVLFDAGLIAKSLGDEPFRKLRAPGWILGEDNRKMSKRWGNVITPDDIIPKFGADTLRMYEMFMGPLEAMKPWSMSSAEGVHRFLRRIYRLFQETHKISGKRNPTVDALLNSLIAKVEKDITNMSFNTAVSAFMETYNNLTAIQKSGQSIDWPNAWRTILKVLAPFAPHLAEELWHELGEDQSIHLESWPKYDPNISATNQITVAIQVNGRVRDQVEVGIQDASNQEAISQLALSSANVKKHLNTANYRAIFVPGKIINFVTE